MARITKPPTLSQPSQTRRSEPKAVKYRQGAAMTDAKHTMKLGDESPQVRRLQQALKKQVPGLKVDGRFGHETLAALKKTQGAKGSGVLSKRQFDKLTKDVPQARTSAEKATIARGRSTVEQQAPRGGPNTSGAQAPERSREQIQASRIKPPGRPLE